MKIVMAGQPNSGKSTIFNAVAGYRSVTANFPGATVTYTSSMVRLNRKVAELVDLPGCYSLSSTNEAELEIRKILLTQSVDSIINVVDASQLGRGLTLTLELMELDIPLVLCLNMMDEAARKGIHIDIIKLSELLGIPIEPVVATKNIGVRKLFTTAAKVSGRKMQHRQKHLICQRDVEEMILELSTAIKANGSNNNTVTPRFLAIKLLEEDDYFIDRVRQSNGSLLLQKAQQLRKQLAENRGRSPDTVMAMERSAAAMEIFRRVTAIRHPKRDWREGLDNIIMHKIWGYVIMMMILVGFFYSVFGVGAFIETPLLEVFEKLETYLGKLLGTEGILFAILKSGLYGVSGGVAIVLPYLIPFLIGLTILEDLGYLPRAAFLMDAFMHRIGLHGTAIIPAVLGYGCSVPAVMATRILPDRRDKIIAAVVATLIPCSARSVVILGLAAYYLGAGAALFVYLLNIVVIALTGRALSALMPGVSPGMIMEVPRYQCPGANAVLKKVWFRIREFVIIAWPLLIAGSIILGIVEYYQWDSLVNKLLFPLTWALGLPAVLGTTLIFGILRKELSLIMLMQALGTTQVLTVMTPAQIMVFTIFITFYIPCVATIAVLIKELGRRWAGAVVGITLVLAMVLALAARLVFLMI